MPRHKADIEGTRSLLGNLIQEAKLYHSSQEYRELLDFTARLRDFAPFNAMLLHLQKPGITYAATVADWHKRFRRYPKQSVRPLLVMRPFGPVALVYDVLDTDGEDLPVDAFKFPARGDMSQDQFVGFEKALQRNAIEPYYFDAGDAKAGSIQVIKRPEERGKVTRYRISINRNHAPATRFVTLAHELAHLFLGHLGPDEFLSIPARQGHSHAQIELEAESVAYVVCNRNGVEARSETYLRYFTDAADKIDIYAIMRAVGKIERLLGL